MLKIFCGWDSRQPLSYNVLAHSIVSRASVPVSIIPLNIRAMPITRVGLTEFTWSRFLVPYLCDFEGSAIFMDSDMLCLGDIAKISGKFDYENEPPAVRVSKNKHRFEWASLIYFHCAHPSNRILTPDFVSSAPALHGMQWLNPREVGELQGEWNFLAGYDDPIPNPKIVHYTQGLPIYPETEGTPFAAEWKAEHKAMNSIKPWKELMGTSVHAAQTADGRLVAKLHKDSVK
jgi:hypothetical protein